MRIKRTRPGRDGAAGPEQANSPAARRVLVYGMNHAPELVGVGRYTADIVVEFMARGHCVTVVAAPPHYPHWSTRPWRSQGFGNRYSRETRDGAEVWRCPLVLPAAMRGIWRLLAPLSFALSSAPVVFWRILRERPALVLCIEPTLLAAPVAVLAARLAGARLALHVQDLEPESAFATNGTGVNLAPMLRWVRRQFDCVATLSPAMAAALADCGIQGDRIHTLPNWTDVRRIARGRDPGLEAAWRQQLGLRHNQRVALCAGTINRKHGPQLLVEAARLLNPHSDIVIVVAGAGALSSTVADAAVSVPNLRVLPMQPEEKLPALLNFADLHLLPQDAALDDLALPSRIGGMLASGKPLVVTATPGSMLAKFLGKAATLCPPADASALAAAISATIPPAGMSDHGGAGRRARWRLALRLDRHRCLPGLINIFEGDGAMPRQRPGGAAHWSASTLRPDVQGKKNAPAAKAGAASSRS